MNVTEKALFKTTIEILFADDEKNVLQSLRRLFMDEEYEILKLDYYGQARNYSSTNA